MFTIAKRFEFSASHQLDHLAADHPCARLHGHNYVVEVEIQSFELDDRGFCKVDYRDLDSFKHWLDGVLDHQHLNDIMDRPTTAEHLARMLYDQAALRCPNVVAVRVSETPSTWAEYRP